jgi:response regulator NasT
MGWWFFLESALIISNTAKSTTLLEEMLTQNNISNISCVNNCGEARRLLTNRSFDLYIINTPLSDEFGEEFACDIASKEISQVILLVKNEIIDRVSDKVEKYGVLTVPKPLNKTNFWSILKLVNAAYAKIQKINQENYRLIKKIEDIRIIDRAKCILIEYLKLSEPEAHRYIEKHAMDMRVTRREVASGIIKTYEN